jgi:hypothetical protein
MRQGTLAGYVAPEVRDYGTLVEMTSAAPLLMGAAHVSDLSFSSPGVPGGGGTIGGGSNTPGPVIASTHGTISDITDSHGTISDPGLPGGTLALAPGSGGSPGGGSPGGAHAGGGGAPGGGHLPFTGFAAGAVAAIGSAFAAGGTLLRRASRSRRSPRP